MIISHNTASHIAGNYYGKNNKAANNALEKLSSGLRINKAADDAAGLTVSEKMRAQIRGAQQAQRNIKDGISLCMTADGGLEEIHNYNHRLMELAVQAANATLTSEDRQALQKEVDQIKSGIDSIANNTHFNGIVLLNIGEPTTIEIEPPSLEKIVTVNPGEKVTAGYVEIPDPPVPAIFSVDALFGTISGSDWPDLNIISPTGQKFGYSESKLNSSGAIVDTSNDSSTKATYTGFTSGDETMTFENPVSGKWYIEIRHTGGTTQSTFTVKSNYLIHSAEAEDPGTVTKVLSNEVNIQAGGNEGDNFRIILTDARTTALGINDIAVDPLAKALEAMGKIGLATEKISAERAKFGAYQNRLESAFKRESLYDENLTGAESRIRDVDMAKEMMSFQKSNILMQASQSILAQANQQPERILELLRS